MTLSSTLSPHSKVSGSIIALSLAVALLTGCSSARQTESQKDLVKLSLNTQEEARKLRDAGNLESAVVKYQEALRYHTSPSLHQELGGVLADLERYPEARRQYELALLENPGMREAEVALEQLDARIQLAESERLPPGGRGADRGSASLADADVSTTPKSSGDFDFIDESAAFREMSEYTPAKASSEAGGSGPTQGSELARDARSLFGVGEDNLDLDYNPEAFEGDAEIGSFAAPQAQVATAGPKSIAPTASALGGAKPLPGGRGLIQGRGIPSLVVSSGPPMRSAREDSAVVEAPLIANAAPSGPIAPRGGRGLGGDRRFPETKQAASPPIRDSAAAPPSTTGTFISRSAEPAQTSAAPPELPRNADLPPKSSGFLSSDPIVYPTPQPSAVSAAEPLPAPGFEKEVLDLSKSSFSDRFKGRRAASLDLEACKRRFYEEGDLEGAIRCFRDKRIDFPESAELHYELGRIYEASGQYPLAREEYLLAIRYAPDREDYKQALAAVDIGQAQQLIEAGNYLPATEILIGTVDRFPNMAPAYRELGKAYSRSALEREQSGAADSPEVREAIALEWRRAEASYRKLLDLTDTDYKDWYNYGVAVQSQYDPAKDRMAIDAYEKTLEMNPTFWDAHYNVAILYETRSPQKAIYHYEEALSLARSDTGPEGKARRIQCLGALGELYWRTNQTDKAAEYLTEYMRLVPDDAQIEQILEQITSAPAIRN